jgi:hypothetical protein
MTPLSHLTSCTPSKSNLYFATSPATYMKLTCIPCTKSQVPFPMLRLYQRISSWPRHMYPFHNKASILWVILALHPNLKLEEHTLSVVPDCLFKIFTAMHYTGGHSSIHNLSTCLDVLTGTHLSKYKVIQYSFVLIENKVIRKNTFEVGKCCMNSMFIQNETYSREYKQIVINLQTQIWTTLLLTPTIQKIGETTRKHSRNVQTFQTGILHLTFYVVMQRNPTMLLTYPSNYNYH